MPTNIEKKVEKLQKENEAYKKESVFLNEKIDELSEKIKFLEVVVEELSEPISIDKVVNSLPIHDAINLLSRLQSNTFGRAQEKLASLRNEAGLLENNLEVMEINSRHLSQGRIYKR